MSQVSSTAVGEVDVPGQFVARHAVSRAPVDTCQRPESTSQAAMVIANIPPRVLSEISGWSIKADGVPTVGPRTSSFAGVPCDA